ncbi:hypothetical protein FB107DRAFT_280805 [Schizophyllum commune]
MVRPTTRSTSNNFAGSSANATPLGPGIGRGATEPGARKPSSKYQPSDATPAQTRSKDKEAKVDAPESFEPPPNPFLKKKGEPQPSPALSGQDSSSSPYEVITPVQLPAEPPQQSAEQSMSMATFKAKLQEQNRRVGSIGSLAGLKTAFDSFAGARNENTVDLNEEVADSPFAKLRNLYSGLSEPRGGTTAAAAPKTNEVKAAASKEGSKSRSRPPSPREPIPPKGSTASNPLPADSITTAINNLRSHATAPDPTGKGKGRASPSPQSSPRTSQASLARENPPSRPLSTKAPSLTRPGGSRASSRSSMASSQRVVEEDLLDVESSPGDGRVASGSMVSSGYNRRFGFEEQEGGYPLLYRSPWLKVLDIRIEPLWVSVHRLHPMPSYDPLEVHFRGTGGTIPGFGLERVDLVRDAYLRWFIPPSDMSWGGSLDRECEILSSLRVDRKKDITRIPEEDLAPQRGNYYQLDSKFLAQIGQAAVAVQQVLEALQRANHQTTGMFCFDKNFVLVRGLERNCSRSEIAASVSVLAIRFESARRHVRDLFGLLQAARLGQVENRDFIPDGDIVSTPLASPLIHQSQQLLGSLLQQQPVKAGQ